MLPWDGLNVELVLTAQSRLSTPDECWLLAYFLLVRSEMSEESRSFECLLKGVQQIFDGLITMARVLFQSAEYHALKRARKRGIEEGRSHWLCFPMMQADLPIAWPIEWHVAGKHLVEKDPHRVHLAALIHVSL